MFLIFIVDLLAVGWLCYAISTKGFEKALPVAAFLLMLFPVESQIQLPGLFDLTTQRILVMVLAVLFITTGAGKQGKLKNVMLPLKTLVIVVIGWMVVASVNSVVPSISFKSTLSQCFDYFVPYYIFAKSVSKIETAHKILFGFVAAMFVCSIFGAIEIYKGWTVVSLFPAVAHRFSDLAGVADRSARAESTFGNPILFGAALAMAIPMALYLLDLGQSKFRKAFLWSAILLMVLCIYQTVSRGPWIALAMSLLLLMVLGKGAIRRRLIFIATLTMMILVLRPGVRMTILNLYGETMDPNSAQGASYQWRYVLYNVANRELSKSIGRGLWGYGPESFYSLGLTTEANVDGAIHLVKVESCDSAVVELMMDTGYVGLCLFATLLLSALALALRHYLRQEKGRQDALFLVVGANITAFCFLMSNVELFGWGQQTYMLWIDIAIAMTCMRFRVSPNVRQRQLQPVNPSISYEKSSPWVELAKS